MKAIISLAFVFICLTAKTVTLAKYQDDDQLHWWDTDDNDEYKPEAKKRIPFPQCLVSKSGSSMFDSYSIQKLFDRKLREEEENLRYEGYENNDHYNDGMTDYDSKELRRGRIESRTAARAAITVTRDIMTVLMCDLNGTDSANLNNVLSKFGLPKELCSYLDKPDCTNRITYRTTTGVCNNVDHPYQGSSQTAFGRISSPKYEDHLSEPRRKSVRGGKLPSCRHLSLAMDSRPAFDRKYNNFFVTFGQVIGHDVALSTPVSDTYSRPISSCKCNHKYDWNKCTVIDIESDDPYIRGQKCMAFPATAQAFKNQICSLGVKEQINGNTHIPDLSVLYGSTQQTSEALRSEKGLMKSTRPEWSKFELPPGQREGKSCTDGTSKRKCLAGGDSRLMITLAFTGIQSIFLRLHNQLAKAIGDRNPDWSSDRIYEETRKLNVAIFQRLIYEHWLPILLGKTSFEAELGTALITTYRPDVPPVVNNEFASAAFRLHTLVRDLFSRCNSGGKRIDELWLHDILNKAKYAYDVENNGVDSIICGALYDYGFAFDSNFAHQIRNRLFESTNQYGQTWRNDLVAINICRGREHGIPSYNTLREHCGLTKARVFEDFADSVNFVGIHKLKRMYKDVNDVDLFVGLNFEDPIEGGIVGHTSACIIGQQFKALRDGDRLFFSHKDVLTAAQLKFVRDIPQHCLICKTVKIQKVPEDIFKGPDGFEDALKDCEQCDEWSDILPPIA